MKKLLSTSLLLAAFAVTFTGCLKDKGFDDHTYGINDPDTQPQGVGFPAGAVAINTVGLDRLTTTQVINDIVFVNLESGVAAKSDVHVTLTLNPTLVGAYNTANGTNIQPLPTSVFNTPSLNLTIPAGARSVQIPINVLSTFNLDVTQTYGVGFSIASVDGGYTIADNLKNVLIQIAIKNAYDGTYTITGAALRAGDAALTGSVGSYIRDFATSGPNSVQWEGSVYWGGQSSTLPAGYEPNITVNPATNLITSITSPAGISMTSPIVRTDIVGSTQRYDPATKTFYFEFTYGGGPTSRLFSLQAKYLRPR